METIVKIAITMEILQVTQINSDVTYECEGLNDAGASARMSTVVTVAQIGGKYCHFFL